MAKFLSFFILFLVSCSTSQNGLRSIASIKELKKLVIYIEGPRGGLGDVASNVVMAKKLQQKGLDITLVVNEEAKDALKILFPDYDPTDEISHSNGFTIQSYKKNSWPKADALASFSSADRIPEDADYPDTYVLREYSEVKPGYLGGNYLISESSFAISNDKVKVKGGKKNSYSFMTGLNQFGAYIDLKKPSPPLSRQELQTYVEAHYPGLNVTLNSADLKLGFSYTHKARPTQLYIDAVAKHIIDSTITEDVVIFVKDFEELRTEQLPDNLKIVRVTSMPFEITQSLIAHSTMPIMITGDVSLTLALEFEKFFFYEMNDWKMNSASDLVESLFSKGTELARDPNHRELKNLLFRIMSISPESPELSVEEISRILLAKNFQKKFSSSITHMRVKHSLAHNFIEFTKFASLFDFPKEGASDVLRPFMKLFFERDVITNDGLLNYAYGAFTDPTKSSEFKLSLFFSMLNLRDFNNEEIQNQFVKIIEQADGKFWILLNNFMQRNLIKAGNDVRLLTIIDSVYRSNSLIAKKKISSTIIQFGDELHDMKLSELVERARHFERIDNPNCSNAMLIFLN